MATLVQVTNVSPSANLQHMSELFSYFGDIEEMRLFPEDELAALSVPSKVCFIRFKEGESMAACLHLSNTVLIDRALIIAKSRYADVPDGATAMSLAAPAIALANSSAKLMGHTAPLLPTPPSMATALNPAGSASIALGITPPVPVTPLISLMNTVATQALGITPPVPQPAAPLISLMGTVVPQPPPLTGNVDPTKIEEIRRTIYVGNLASNMTAEQVLTFFQPCGEIKYVRMAGDETQPTRFAFVEFATPESVPIALQYNGAMFGERPVKVNHSKNAIVKPQGPTPQEAKRDVDEAMKRVKEAMMDIEASVVPGTATKPTKPTARSRSRERRHRSRSRSRDRRRRSRSQSPARDRYRSSRGWRRSRSRSPPRKPRSRSPPRRRSRSRSPVRRRSRSRSPVRRRSRSKSPVRRRSRSKSPVRRRSRSRSPVRRRSRSRSPVRRRSRSRSPRFSRNRHQRSRSRSFSPRRRRSRSPRRRDRRRDDSVERGGRDRSPPRRKSPSLTPEPSPPPPPKKSSKSKKHRRRSPSRSPSPSAGLNSPSERSSSRRKKHSKKHRRHRRKSPSPSPVPSPVPSDKENGRGCRENSVGSGGSPPLDGRGSDSDVGSPEAKKVEVEPDTDSSYD